MFLDEAACHPVNHCKPVANADAVVCVAHKTQIRPSHLFETVQLSGLGLLHWVSF